MPSSLGGVKDIVITDGNANTNTNTDTDNARKDPGLGATARVGSFAA